MIILATLAAISGVALLLAGIFLGSRNAKRWGIGLLCAVPVIILLLFLGFL